MADSSPKSPPEGEQFDEEFDLSKLDPRLRPRRESSANVPREPLHRDFIEVTVIILRGRP
jgi:hypothetical protein